MVEIVSPILRATPSENLGRWRHEIIDMFKYLDTLCAIRSNRSCGFHIHLSPMGDDWTLDELKGISTGIIHFEQAFEAMVPETRRGNQFIRSNRFFGNEQLKNLRHSECIAKIQSQNSVRDLAGVMSSDRYTTWNFENLKKDSRKGTLEFRQPPGQTRAAGCLSWIELAMSFVQSARRKDWRVNIREYPQTVSGLKKFITEGFVEGLSKGDHLEPLMHSKNADLSIVPKAPEYDIALMMNKEKEDKKKNILMEKLKEILQKELQNPRASK